MLKASRAALAAFLMVLVAQPVAARVSGAADGAPGTAAHPQTTVSAAADLGADPVTDREILYTSVKNSVQQSAVVSLPDEFSDPAWTMTQIALAVLMLVMIAIGLAITFTLHGPDRSS